MQSLKRRALRGDCCSCCRAARAGTPAGGVRGRDRGRVGTLGRARGRPGGCRLGNGAPAASATRWGFPRSERQGKSLWARVKERCAAPARHRPSVSQPCRTASSSCSWAAVGPWAACFPRLPTTPPFLACSRHCLSSSCSLQPGGSSAGTKGGLFRECRLALHRPAEPVGPLHGVLD